MKTITKYLTLALLVIFSIHAKAQKKKDKILDTVGVVKTMDDEISYMLAHEDEPIRLASEDIWWTNPSGKRLHRHQDEIKWMKVYDRVFINVPRDPGQGDGLVLMEVLARNEKYFLLSWWSDSYYYYIFDIHGNAPMRGRKANHDEKVIEDVRGYFKDCQELIDKMNKNFETKDESVFGKDSKVYVALQKGIKDIQCSESALTFESFTEMLEKKPWYDKFEETARKRLEKEREKETKQK